MISNIWIAILVLLIGIAASVWGANLLVDNASIMARKLGLSEFVIGIVIVGIGTSFPEMSVSFYSSIMGMPDMSVGNIVGSDIFNTLLILGVTSMIAPIFYEKENVRRDIPVAIASAVILTVMALIHNDFSRLEGIILLVLFGVYMFWILREGRKDAALKAAKEGKPAREKMSAGKTAAAILLILFGLALLVFGGKCFVDGASFIARACGVTDAFIAITIVAAGTSLPELTSNIVSITKNKGQMALGNIIGSNIFNILLIVGGSATIHPLTMSNVTWVDFAVLILSQAMMLVAAFTFRKHRLDKQDGILYLLCYGGYLAWPISQI
ncbi:MAG: calcium/sodium antiporter [Bacteroidales bacterium]